MNYMSVVLSGVKVENEWLAQRIEKVKLDLKKNHVKIVDKYKKVGNQVYYKNAIPYISNMRDVLVKPREVCNMRVNWKRKDFSGMTTQQILETELKQQFGWIFDTVDTEHSRNNYKNKESIWVIFDSKEKAQKAMEIFNSMFLTAIEQDCIDEYKKFKKSPMKRPLTFDKLLPPGEAYKLYQLVDEGKI